MYELRQFFEYRPGIIPSRIARTGPREIAFRGIVAAARKEVPSQVLRVALVRFRSNVSLLLAPVEIH